MKIKNNTNKTLTIYLGNVNEEEPDMVKTLLVGEDVDLPENIPGDISIQEQ